jgi:betaine-aldehyde dehydrogenase
MADALPLPTAADTARESFSALLGAGAEPGSFVGGALAAGQGEAITLSDPATGAELARYRDAGAVLVDEAARIAADAQRQWMTLPAALRGRKLWAWGEAVEAAAPALARLESATSGKPIRDCAAEVSRVAEMLRYWAGWTDKILGEVIPVPSGHLVYTRPEPLGVVLAITPWNAPLFTAGWNLAPALACGNAVLLKPSEVTPLSSLAFAKLAEAAGLPRGLVQVIAGLGPSTGAAAVAHALVAKVTFVGSPEGGAVVAGLAARHAKGCVLELGGKSANIVFADADLDRAVRGAQAAIFAGCGQSCVAGSRLLVARAIHDRFVADVAAGAERIRVGLPLDPATEMGPIATERQYARVTGLVAEGLASGARLATGGAAPENLPPRGNWLAPTLLAGIDNSSRAAQEEIFGPVLVTVPFDDEADAVRLANATRFGLAAAVWTRDVSRAHRMAGAVRAGTFWVNGYRSIHVSVPFGGFGASGHGRSSGTAAIGEYTAPKAVWVDSAEAPAMGFGYGPAPA